MLIKSCMVTDVGKTRGANQDNFVFADEYNRNFDTRLSLVRTLSLEKDWGVMFGVFDGVGGDVHGEEAARIAAREFRSPFITQDMSVELDGRMRRANDCIYEWGRQFGFPGTTGTVIGAWNETIHYAHIGDSRIYRFRGDTLFQITNDHTLAHLKIQAGIYQSDDPLAKKESHVLLRCLGAYDNTALLGVEKGKWNAQSGDRLLICSDGLYDMCDMEVLREVIAAKDSLTECASELVNRALDNGGTDNITVIVLEFTLDGIRDPL